SIFCGNNADLWYKEFLANEDKLYFINYEAHTCDMKLKLGENQSIKYINSHPESEWEITLAETGFESMTGARVKRVEKYIDEDIFMLTYGDGLGDIDIQALLEFHKSHGRILTVTGVNPPGRFGALLHDENNIATGFNEKPQAAGGRISGGYFVCNRQIFDYLNNDVNLIFERDPMEALVRDKQMMVYKHDGFWQPMDTHREYLILNELYETKKAPWFEANMKRKHAVCDELSEVMV
ncbi:MAG: hypothetical protein K0U12_07455, partial [Gammaproteobacteria bacterium]|nr:hypothetical protein [Gammaproteobacteria bacterium]